MIRAVLFDMDGTLFDTEVVLCRVWQKMVDAGSLPADFMGLLPSMVGKIRSAISADLRAHYGADFPVEEIFRQRAELVQKELDLHGVPLKPHVPQIFEELRERGIHMALVTSTSAPSVADYMRRTGFGEYFSTYVTGNRVSNGKPAPDCFLLAAEELGCAPEECLVVEDSNNGVRAGAAAGMRVILIPDIQEPTPEIRELAWRQCRSLAEVTPLVDALNEGDVQGLLQ
ncbi:MAG: HAD family phosphatase [Ruminococcaceae bacterium]|nr:HAD family phosphatase [Oscillospiraceae bacterium]